MLKNIAPKGRGRAVTNARQLRRAMSLPEVLLWRELRARPKGLKFRRQHASGPYVLDFFCSDARMAIEVDGETQAYGGRPIRDGMRDAWFAKGGILTLRIAASDVLNDLESVLTMVVREAHARLPLHHPAAPGGPPPRAKLEED